MLYAIVVVLILILDQGLKYWTSLNIDLDTGTRVLIPGFIRLTNIHNTGAAFSILQNARWFFVVLTILFAIAVVALLAIPVIKGRFGRWTAALVLAGALGNCIDRAFLGWVVDMFEFEFMRFPVFNIADIFITVGGALFCLYIIFHKDYDEDGFTAAERAAKDKARRMHQKTVEQQRTANIEDISKDTGRFRTVSKQTELEEIAKTAEDARRRAEHKHAPKPAPKPAPRPAPAPKPAPKLTPASPPPKAERSAPIPFNPSDPFAEWERAARAGELGDVTVSTAVIRDPEDMREPAPKPATKPAPAEAGRPQPKATPAPKSAPAPKKAEKAPESGEAEFSLEDILAEFKDL